jgi:hypothetical protein
MLEYPDETPWWKDMQSLGLGPEQRGVKIGEDSVERLKVLLATSRDLPIAVTYVGTIRDMVKGVGELMGVLEEARMERGGKAWTKGARESVQAKLRFYGGYVEHVSGLLAQCKERAAVQVDVVCLFFFSFSSDMGKSREVRGY